MSKTYPILGSPIQINGMIMPNRLMTTSMSPCDGYIAPDNKPTQRLANYLAERAAGKTGLIIQTVVPWKRSEEDMAHGLHALPSCYDETCIPSLRQYMVDPVHRNGGRIAAQIYCVHDWKPSPEETESPWGPSDIAILKFMGGFKAMSIEQIKTFQEQFVNGAQVCKEAGFDAIEVMAGVGGIMSRFMARATNNRTDEYGGSLENRARFACEVISACREALGEDFPIIVRWSPVDFIESQAGPGLQMEEALQICRMLENAGADLHDLAVGWHETSVPLTTKKVEDGHWMWIAEKIKTVAEKPVAQGYRNTDPAIMEKNLSEGKCDVIAGLRYSIADPDLPRKVMEDRTDDMRECIVCCRCLNDVVSAGKPLNYCGVNPRLGEEIDHQELPALKNGKKRVLVAGAGPAGINAAVYAAKRGHEVDLYEAGPRVGGSVKMSSIFSPYHERYLRYMKHLLKTTQGVNLHLNSPVTADSITDSKADVCILAIGGDVLDLDVPGEDGRNVINSHMFLDMLNGRKPKAEGAFNNFMWWGATAVLRHYYTPKFARKATSSINWPIGRDVAIIGGGLAGCEMGELCMRTGRKITIIEEGKRVGYDVGASDRFSLMQDFKKADNVTMMPLTKVVEITGEGVEAVSVDKDANTSPVFIPAKTVAVTLGLKRNSDLYDAVKNYGGEVYLIGDADDPQRIADATKAGYRIACMI